MLPELVTSRLRLVPMAGRDLDRLHALLALPEIRRFLCDDRVLPRDAVADLLARSVACAAEGLGLWSLHQSGGGWIGCIGLMPVEGASLAARPDFAGEVEPAVALHPARFGAGYATEALKAVLAHAFGTLRRDRVVALADLPNAASLAMLRRAGFREIGRARGARFELAALECVAPTARAKPSAAPAPASSPPPSRNS
jgi:ribosomal-protein-alanine N-acetyltransferase